MMIRLTWRQARPNLLSSAALLLLIAVFSVLAERAMSDSLRTSGLSGCLAGGGNCARLQNVFFDENQGIIKTYQWLNFVPLMIGLFWGGPLIAREIEQGTHRLAWTQSVSRRRWLTVRFGCFALGAIAVAAIVTWLLTRGLSPISLIPRYESSDAYSRMNPNVFDFEGIAPVAYTLFAFALGAAAGAVTKKVLPAMEITLVLFLPFRLVMQSLRSHLVSASTVTYPFATASPRNDLGDWVFKRETISPTGQVVGRVPVAATCDQLTGNGCTPPGYSMRDTYHPLSQFWSLQVIESGIFLGAALLCLGVTVWWTLRRVA
jgi:ABC-type transport system involved in multi-copper enzyme maturation permease subunit